jgi:hypothetical protein
MKSFEPIASRTLIFKSFSSDKVTQKITVAVSAPYSPPRDKSARANAGCMVLTGGEPEFAQEVWGIDEIEALQVALAHVQVFLRELANSGKGELRTEDGAAFDPEGSAFLTQYLEATQRS